MPAVMSEKRTRTRSKSKDVIAAVEEDRQSRGPQIITFDIAGIIVSFIIILYRS